MDRGGAHRVCGGLCGCIAQLFMGCVAAPPPGLTAENLESVKGETAERKGGRFGGVRRSHGASGGRRAASPQSGREIQDYASFFLLL